MKSSSGDHVQDLGKESHIPCVAVVGHTLSRVSYLKNRELECCPFPSHASVVLEMKPTSLCRCPLLYVTVPGEQGRGTVGVSEWLVLRVLLCEKLLLVIKLTRGHQRARQ